MTVAVGADGSGTAATMTAPGIAPGDRIAGALALTYSTGTPDAVAAVDLAELSITGADELTIDGTDLADKWVIVQFDKAYDNY